MTDRARYEVVWSGPDVNWESTTFTMLRSDPAPRKAAREHVARETRVSVDNIELAVLEPLDGDTGAQRADEPSADPPGEAPPAATTDLEQEDVHRALLADDADRHGHLDPYAGAYL